MLASFAGSPPLVRWTEPRKGAYRRRCRHLAGVHRRATLFVTAALLTMAPHGVGAAGKNVEGVVNLNTAPADLLSLLPGIGPSKARAIVDYRVRRPFRTVDELVRIKGIGRRMVREIRAHLATAGPSTARGVSGSAVAVDIRPVVSPPRPPLVVRPPSTVGASKPLGARPSRGGTPLRPVRSPANHCEPPP